MVNRFRNWMAVLVLGLVSAASGGPEDFTVHSGDAKFRLSDARGKFVALHFLLETECPYCQEHVAETVRRAPELAGVIHLFLKPDSEEEILGWSAKLQDAGIAATIYRDPEARLAKEYRIPGGYSFHGKSVHYPALILLGPDGDEIYRYVGKDNTDRLAFDKLAGKVAELSTNAGVRESNLSNGTLALSGHDPVAYFESGKPEAGKPELVSRFRGVTYYFATPERRAAFAANPEKYVPAYGGWCATAMAAGRKVEIDPASFKITGGRLFLFYKGWFANALDDWNKDEKNLTAKADEQWKKLAPIDAKGRN